MGAVVEDVPLLRKGCCDLAAAIAAREDPPVWEGAFRQRGAPAPQPFLNSIEQLLADQWFMIAGVEDSLPPDRPVIDRMLQDPV